MPRSLPAPVALVTRKKRKIGSAARPPIRLIERRIYVLRNLKVMLDSDLAELYQVETKALNRAVKRNPSRFPADFMFQLTASEASPLRYQFGASNDPRGGRRYLPYAFTEHGVAMLSSVLNSERAVQMNILIIRAFVKLREVLATHRALARKIEQLQHTQKDHAAVLTIVVNDIQDLEKRVRKGLQSLTAPPPHKPRSGVIVGKP
jgi:phage regulator Rha-like protein